ncbi:MAG: flavin-containing monooxygenase [Hyphomonadaceae bacterium]
MEHFDVLIVGAGLSGIGAGAHLKMDAPGKSYVILEARDAIGGTWDLFRYPGIRSDSDMYTLGFSFKPWTEAKAIADGPAILKYVRETADEYGVTQNIRFHHKVKKASWSSQDARWTIEALRTDTNETVKFTAGFVFMAAGYYSYDETYRPAWDGFDSYKGQVIHPQFWPEDLDYTGKRVVVIGSGATAVTIVPEMAKTAAHVTMLQRSPTYVVSRPAEDAIANGLRKFLPASWAYGITRWKNVNLQMYFYNMARKHPEKTKERMLEMAKKELDAQIVDAHFTPTYNVWDQRVCLVPDADLFAAIREDRASVVTDHIERFAENGIQLKSGQTLDADIVVTATGLKLNVLGDVQLSVDGEAVDLAKRLTFKGMMYEGVPNLASAFGYTNASWTLKCDLTCEHVCRLLNYMDETGFASATPRNSDPTVGFEPWLNLNSGYIQRAAAYLPKQGDKAPWKLHQNYMKDIDLLRRQPVTDEALVFARKPAARQDAARSLEAA